LNINPEEKAALLKRYSERLSQYGPTDAALGWNKPKQKLRYRILLDYWFSQPSPRPLRVLDFGCGFGDLYGYAREHGLALDYTGLDINDDLLEVARTRYPEARFLFADAFAEPILEAFDIVLSSGVHNHRLADNRAFTEHSFEVFDRISIIGFAVNFLSSRVNFKNSDNHYHIPEDILALALSHSPRVSLRHDYMPFEFTVFVDKRKETDERLSVFSPFVNDCTG
jgi:SAM-dependent methyltransferase